MKDSQMNRFSKSAVIALAVVGMTVATVAQADTSNTTNSAAHTVSLGREMAAVSISFDFGNIVAGYSDGYWDNNHRWHRWSNARQHQEYRNRNANSYHGMRHTRAPNNGWQDRGNNSGRDGNNDHGGNNGR